jgi:hypothetical protein
VVWGIARAEASKQPIQEFTMQVRLSSGSKNVFSFGPAGSKSGLDVEVLRGEAAATVAGVAEVDGLFAISGLPDADVICELSANGYLNWMSEKLRVLSGELLEISPSCIRAATISGIVVDHEGTPVAGASVPADVVSRSTRNNTFFSRRSQPFRPSAPTVDRTDATGRFVYGGLAAGEIEIAASHPAHLDSEVFKTTLQTGEDLKDQVLQLRAAGALIGRVFDENGSPLPEGVIKLRDINTKEDPSRAAFPIGLGQTRLQCTADQQGGYRLEGVEPGVYSVVLSAPQKTGQAVPGLIVFGGKKVKSPVSRDVAETPLVHRAESIPETVSSW